jgi:peptidoglycan/xylan/chitin deacetylase (PgdA/CDA1 family)
MILGTAIVSEFLVWIFWIERMEWIEPTAQSLFIFGMALFVILAGFVSYYEYRGIGPQDGIFRRGFAPGERVVSLTFDDGPSPVYTTQILDILARHGIKATFFVTGRHVEKYPEIAHRIVAEGHDIGNHSYSHCNMVLLDDQQLQNEIKKAERAIIKSAGVRPTLFRPPRGVYSNRVRRAILDEGYQIVLWSVSTMDWSPFGTGIIASRVKMFTRNGSIVLFHDSGSLVRREGGNRRSTVESLPTIIEYLKSHGYEIVPVSELLLRTEEKSCFNQAS